MPSAWVVRRTTPKGKRRYQVRFRLGGAESRQRYAGSFTTRDEALARKRWVDGELAALRGTFGTGRISLLHLGGVPWARIGEHVGQRNLAVTANTYSHVLADEAELDHQALLEART